MTREYKDVTPDYEEGYRAALDEERGRWISLLEHGCGDSNCVLYKPRGMATNGGCQCLKVLAPDQRRRFLHALNTLRADILSHLLEAE